jgi:raffinose/stachyose/melibiose transport system substrate-binding protein
MRKAFLTVAALLAAVTMVAFAGGKKEGAAPAEPVTLNVLWYADATQAGYQDDVAIRQKFVTDNPNFKMVFEELFNEPYHDKLSAYIAAGTMPDVMFLWPSLRSSSALVHQRKLAKDLTPLLGKDFLASFIAAAVDPNQQASKQLSELPQAVTYTTAMYTNTKLLKDNGLAVPKTYDEMKALVPKLKAKGIKTLMIANVDKWPFQSCLFSTITGRLLGNEWWDQAIAGKAKFTDAGFVNALNFVQTMFKDGVMDPADMQLQYGDGPGLFATGKAAFLIDGDWRVGAFLTDKTSGVALIPPAAQQSDFEILNFPAIPGEKNPGVVSAIAGTGYAISASVPAGSAKEAAAVKFIKYLYSPEVLKIRLETGAFIPSRKGITSDKTEPLTNKQVAYYLTIPKITYVIDGVIDPGVNDVLQTGLQAIGLGTATPAQVAADIQKAMDSWLATKK